MEHHKRNIPKSKSESSENEFDELFFDENMDINQMLDKINEFDLALMGDIGEIDNKNPSFHQDVQNIKDLKKIAVESSSGDLIDTVKNNEYDSLIEWSNSNGINFIAPHFIEHGFDDIRFIKNILEKDDLNLFGIYDDRIQKIIMDCIQNLSDCPKIDAKSREEFNSKYLLDLCNLSMYQEAFIAQGYDSCESLLALDSLPLQVLLDVKCDGHIKRICHYIKEANSLFAELERPKHFTRSLTQDFEKKPKKEFARSSLDACLSRNEASVLDTEGISHEKATTTFEENRTGRIIKPKASEVKTKQHLTQENASTIITTSPKPNKKFGQKISKLFKKSSHKNWDDMKEALESLDLIGECDSEAHIYRKTYSSSSEPNSLSSSPSYSEMHNLKEKTIPNIWIHSEQQLLYDSVIILSHFMGMQPVKNMKIRGRKLTEGPTLKLTSLAANLNKWSEVIVKITAFEVAIVNKDSNLKICGHDMKSIFFCAQDPSDQRVFAFVHRGEKKDENLCSVFRCSNIKSCVEAVLALGHAFQILKQISGDV